MEKNKGSGIWIFWAVLFGLISLLCATGLVLMYLYFTGKQVEEMTGSAPVSVTEKESEEEAAEEPVEEVTEKEEKEEEKEEKEEEKEEASEPEEPAGSASSSEVPAASGAGEGTAPAAVSGGEAEVIRQEARDELLSEMKAFMQKENSTVKLLRKFFTNDVVVYANGGYQFVPLNPDLAPNPYDPERFSIQEPGERMVYDGAETHFGIDVSKFQGEIDWEAVAGDGVEFAIIRVGVRGYSEGAIMPDETFAANVDGAAANGIHTGVYFFSQAKNETEVDEEIEFIFDSLEGHSVDGPIVLDVEDVINGSGRTGSLTAAERTDLTLYFCKKVEERGYSPMIYGNLHSLILMLDISRLEAYPKWFAFYDTPLYFPYAFDIYQYKDTGKINGIEGEVDFDLAFRVWYD